MNTVSRPRHQRGSVLLIALMLLIALTLLTLSNMRGVSLESRITANRVEASSLQNLADAALREGEFRFYGQANLQDKLEQDLENCTKGNKIKRLGFNKPCLLGEMSTDQLNEFFKKPLTFMNGEGLSGFDKYKAADIDSAGTGASLAWMPYVGTDPKNIIQTSDTTGRSYWNAYAMPAKGTNPEYGAVDTGSGTYFYLITGLADKGNNQIVTQSVLSVIYPGLDN